MTDPKQHGRTLVGADVTAEQRHEQSNHAAATSKDELDGQPGLKTEEAKYEEDQQRRIRKNGELMLHIVRAEQSMRVLDEYEENARTSLKMHLQLIDNFTRKDAENKARLKEIQNELKMAEKHIAKLSKKARKLTTH